MPSTVCLVLIAAGLVLICRNRARSDTRAWRAGFSMSAIGAMLLYLSCTPLIATWLAASLERMTPGMPVAAAPKCDAIVVLGSSFHWHREKPGDPLILTAMTERLRVAVEAYKMGKAPWLVLGGGGKDDEPKVCEGAFQKQEAMALGVPESAIMVGLPVLNTEGEALQHAATLRALNAKKILLATSVWHLPRASMQFRALGFEVVGLPCHYLTAGVDEQFSLAMLLPRAQALDQTETCVKEYLGLLSARLFPPRETATGTTP